MATPAIESQWYVALYEEDCLQVMELLEEHPALLKVGWNSEPSRVVEGCWPNYFSPWSKSAWKGRTALHVGARRGSVQLVKQILALCNLHKVISIYDLRETESIEATLARKDTAELQGALDKFKGNVPLRRYRRRTFEPPPGSSLPSDVPVVADMEIQAATTSTSHEDDSGDTHSQSNLFEIELAEISSYASSSSFQNDAPNATEDDRLTEVARSTLAHWHREVEARKSSVRRAFYLWKQKADRQESNTEGSSGTFDCTPSHSPLTQSPLSYSPAATEFSEDDDGDFGKTTGGPLERLLTSIDGEYGLDALAMAAAHGNHNIMDLISYAILECETPPYNVNRKFISPTALNANDNKLRAKLRKAIQEVIASCPNDPTFDEYSKHRDFNFLPKEEYIFHFMFTDRYYKKVQFDSSVSFPAALWGSARWFSSDLWRFLLKLEDGQGRTLLHVAVDEKTALDLLADLQMRIDQNRFVPMAVSSAMHARDGAGRTPWHRAVASGAHDILHELVWFAKPGVDEEEHVGHLASEPSDLSVSADSISERNGFKGQRTWKHRDNLYGNYEEGIVQSTPLHSAIILKNTQYLNELCNRNARELYSDDYKPFFWVLKEGDEGRDVKIQLDIMELATLLGNRRVVKHLLENGYQITPKKFSREDRYPGRYGEYSIWYHPWPALHLAASSGSYEMLKLFLDDPLCHPFIEDYEGNTALHHALKVRDLEFHTHLLDYANCKHIIDTRRANGEVSHDKNHGDTERQSCVNLLIQAGCDIFKANKLMEVPYPRGLLSGNTGFLSWWNEKQTKEFGEVQKSLNIAANAISVTAALVATTSFIGPLQPPLGYNPNSNQIQVDNHWVRLFIFCDTVSFYLAITAITISLIPCLPLPQQSMIDELRRIRRMVTLAVAILFPSIICVLVAFAASAIAVTNSKAWSESKILIIVATIMCAPLFLGGFLLFLIRLLGIAFPTNSYIRSLHNATFF